MHVKCGPVDNVSELILVRTSYIERYVKVVFLIAPIIVPFGPGQTL